MKAQKVGEDGKRDSPLVLLFVDHRAVALWEVDGPQGSLTGVPNSMYLITGTQPIFCGNIHRSLWMVYRVILILINVIYLFL